MSFDKLLAELSSAQTEQDTLAKSLTATGENEGGEAGQAAAGSTTEGAAGATGTEGAAGAEGGAELTKSFKVTLADGTETDAVDGTELIKSLQERMDASEKQTGEVVTQLLGLVKGQSSLIKSLSEQVQILGGQGRGRKTVISVTEKAPLAKSEGASQHGGASSEGGVSIEDFMSKSHDAFENKRISGIELTTIDVACRSGAAIDPGLVKKVLAGGK